MSSDMSTTVPLLTTPDQLEGDGDVFQLGTESDACTVLFGVSHYDKDKRYRTLKLVPSATAEATLAEHVLAPLKTSPRGDQQMVTIKVSAQDTAITDKGGASLTIDDLKPGTQLLCVVRTYHWSMKDKKGISLQAQAIRVLGHKQRKSVLYDFS